MVAVKADKYTLGLEKNLLYYRWRTLQVIWHIHMYWTEGLEYLNKYDYYKVIQQSPLLFIHSFRVKLFYFLTKLVVFTFPQDALVCRFYTQEWSLYCLDKNPIIMHPEPGPALACTIKVSKTMGEEVTTCCITFAKDYSQWPWLNLSAANPATSSTLNESISRKKDERGKFKLSFKDNANLVNQIHSRPNKFYSKIIESHFLPCEQYIIFMIIQPCILYIMIISYASSILDILAKAKPWLSWNYLS